MFITYYNILYTRKTNSIHMWSLEIVHANLANSWAFLFIYLYYFVVKKIAIQVEHTKMF